jgi:hypothetical protein
MVIMLNDKRVLCWKFLNNRFSEKHYTSVEGKINGINKKDFGSVCSYHCRIDNCLHIQSSEPAWGRGNKTRRISEKRIERQLGYMSRNVWRKIKKLIKENEKSGRAKHITQTSSKNIQKTRRNTRQTIPPSWKT